MEPPLPLFLVQDTEHNHQHFRPATTLADMEFACPLLPHKLAPNGSHTALGLSILCSILIWEVKWGKPQTQGRCAKKLISLNVKCLYTVVKST
jgi:hypothetical protein